MTNVKNLALITALYILLIVSSLPVQANNNSDMELKDKQVKQWVENYFSATRSGKPKLWVSTFAKNAVVEDPVGRPPLTSSKQILQHGEGIVKAFSSTGLYESFIHINGLEAAAMWEYRGVTLDGKPVSFKGIKIFVFNDSGKIVSLRGFWQAPQ